MDKEVRFKFSYAVSARLNLINLVSILTPRY